MLVLLYDTPVLYNPSNSFIHPCKYRTFVDLLFDTTVHLLILQYGLSKMFTDKQELRRSYLEGRAKIRESRRNPSKLITVI